MDDIIFEPEALFLEHVSALYAGETRTIDQKIKPLVPIKITFSHHFIEVFESIINKWIQRELVTTLNWRVFYLSEFDETQTIRLTQLEFWRFPLRIPGSFIQFLYLLWLEKKPNLSQLRPKTKLLLALCLPSYRSEFSFQDFSDLKLPWQLLAWWLLKGDQDLFHVKLDSQLQNKLSMRSLPWLSWWQTDSFQPYPLRFLLIEKTAVWFRELLEYLNHPQAKNSDLFDFYQWKDKVLEANGIGNIETVLTKWKMEKALGYDDAYFINSMDHQFHLSRYLTAIPHAIAKYGSLELLP